MKTIATLILAIMLSGCYGTKNILINDRIPEIFKPQSTEQIIIKTNENGEFSAREIEEMLNLIIRLRQENEILIHNIDIFNEYRINRENQK